MWLLLFLAAIDRQHGVVIRSVGVNTPGTMFPNSNRSLLLT